MPLNFGHSTVVTPPSPATSGLSLTVTAGTGGRFEAGPAVLCPEGQDPTPENAEIVTILSRSVDTLTLSARAVENTTARAVVAGYRILQGITAGLWDLTARADLAGDLLASTSTFYIAHRGGGDEAPEHTKRAYAQALSRGDAAAIEVSAQTTGDGVPICMHDVGASSLSRTTSLSTELGAVPLAAVAGTVVDSGANDSSTGGYALGAGYTTTHRLPLLGDVLDLLVHKTVIFLEPKANPEAILQAIEWVPEPGKTIVWKFFRSGTTTAPTHAQTAAARGIRTWVYLSDDDTDQVIADTLTYADSIGIEKTATDERIEALVALADAAGVPVIVHPIRRRSERDRVVALGVKGIMCTAPSYVNYDEARLASWPLSAGVRLPGDYWALESRRGTYDPANSQLQLGQGSNGGIVVGSMCPVPDPAGAGGGYRISWQMKWITLPSDLTTHSDLYVCHASDASYINQSAGNVDGGYHVFMRANGTMAIFRHDPGSASGTSLGTATSDAAVADTWMSFECDVTATQITFRRTDPSPDVAFSVSNTTYRGGYFGFSAATTSVAPLIRNVTVAEL